MIELIPVQYRMAALAAAFVVSASVAFGAGWTVNGWRLGKAQAEDDYRAASEAFDLLTGRLNGAAARAGTLKTALDGLGRSAVDIRKDIANVLPPRESDHACDLPAAARGLLNRSSGYDGGLPGLDAAHP